MGDGHPRRNRVGIDDQVGDDPLRGEGHVLLRSDQSDHTLLAVSGRELVPQFRHPEVADLHLRQLRTVLALREHDGIDPSALAVTHGHRRLAAFLRRQEVRLFFEEARGARFSDQDVAPVHEDLRRDEAVIRREVRVRKIRAGPRTSGEGISKWSSWPPGYRRSSARYVRMNEDRPRPRSMEALFITIASSMLYPWWDMTATTKFWPAGRSLNETYFIESVWMSGCHG